MDIIFKFVVLCLLSLLVIAAIDSERYPHLKTSVTSSTTTGDLPTSTTSPIGTTVSKSTVPSVNPRDDSETPPTDAIRPGYHPSFGVDLPAIGTYDHLLPGGSDNRLAIDDCLICWKFWVILLGFTNLCSFGIGISVMVCRNCCESQRRNKTAKETYADTTASAIQLAQSSAKCELLLTILILFLLIFFS